ncbi:SseB family protein [Marinactinospora thermotolerans]|uniref:SseB family protein n=1 Tax=Marinactinospora thermotolerans TaxID=531310 RepID=UPI003D8E1ECF
MTRPDDIIAADPEEFPVNAVERALEAALAASPEQDSQEEAEPITRFLDALREGDLWIPLPEGAGQQGDGAVALPTLELEGEVFVPVFTSAEQFRVRSADLAYTVIPARELAGALPEGIGLALNPGNASGVPLYAETVAELARG